MSKGVIVGLVVVVMSLGRAEVTFRVYSGCGTVEVSEVEEEGTVDLTVSAEWPQGAETYVIYTPMMPELSGMKVMDHIPFGETLSEVTQVLQRIVHQFKLVVTNAAGTRVGTGPIIVEYRRGDGGDRERRELSGLSLRVVKRRGGLGSGVVAGALGVLAVAAGLVGVSSYGRRKRGRGEGREEVSLESRYLEELEGSKRWRVEGELGKYFAVLERILREYLREKYCIGNIEEWEVGERGHGALDERSVGVAKELVGLSQRVRYGGHVASVYEQRRMYEFVKELLERNCPRREAPEELKYVATEKRR
ncbi:MAG: hypothetical protein N2595_04595 [bacterium]|nr:hypothetical protein [bacterium]